MRQVGLRACIVLVASLLLAACASDSLRLLNPIAATAPDASKVDLLVATSRQPSADPGELFSGERARVNSFAAISVSIPPDARREVGKVQWPTSTMPDPSREFATLSAEVLTLPQIVARGHVMAARANGRVFVFVHGFNNRFDQAVFHFAQIVHDSGAVAVPVLYTWPSRGKLSEYLYDRASADFSRDGLERVLSALDRDAQVKEVVVLAHSMGSWLTMETLRQMAIRNGRVDTKIHHVMLAAADVDIDVFRTQIDQFGDRGPNFTLFVSHDDQALSLSKFIWSSSARLGDIDASQEPLHSELQARRIAVVDLSALQVAGVFSHNKFSQIPDVVRAIGERLARGQTLVDR
jgi:esterase/lipase superfamily enzyme